MMQMNSFSKKGIPNNTLNLQNTILMIFPRHLSDIDKNSNAIVMKLLIRLLFFSKIYNFGPKNFINEIVIDFIEETYFVKMAKVHANCLIKYLFICYQFWQIWLDSAVNSNDNKIQKACVLLLGASKIAFQKWSVCCLKFLRSINITRAHTHRQRMHKHIFKVIIWFWPRHERTYGSVRLFFNRSDISLNVLASSFCFYIYPITMAFLDVPSNFNLICAFARSNINQYKYLNVAVVVVGFSNNKSYGVTIVRQLRTILNHG